MARYSSYDSAICYVLPVMWMTSCIHIKGSVDHNEARRYVSSSSPDGGTGALLKLFRF